MWRFPCLPVHIATGRTPFSSDVMGQPVATGVNWHDLTIKVALFASRTPLSSPFGTLHLFLQRFTSFCNASPRSIPKQWNSLPRSASKEWNSSVHFVSKEWNSPPGSLSKSGTLRLFAGTKAFAFTAQQL